MSVRMLHTDGHEGVDAAVFDDGRGHGCERASSARTRRAGAVMEKAGADRSACPTFGLPV